MVSFGGKKVFIISTKMSLPTKTDQCDDVEVVIPPCDQSSKDMGPDEVKVQEIGDGILIHFKNVPESAVDLLAEGDTDTSTDTSTDGSFGSDFFKSFHKLHMNVGSCIDRNKKVIRMVQ